jgi:hypothetical protein
MKCARNQVIALNLVETGFISGHCYCALVVTGPAYSVFEAQSPVPIIRKIGELNDPGGTGLKFAVSHIAPASDAWIKPPRSIFAQGQCCSDLSARAVFLKVCKKDFFIRSAGCICPASIAQVMCVLLGDTKLASGTSC